MCKNVLCRRWRNRGFFVYLVGQSQLKSKMYKHIASNVIDSIFRILNFKLMLALCVCRRNTYRFTMISITYIHMYMLTAHFLSSADLNFDINQLIDILQ